MHVDFIVEKLQYCLLPILYCNGFILTLTIFSYQVIIFAKVNSFEFEISSIMRIHQLYNGLYAIE